MTNDTHDDTDRDIRTLMALASRRAEPPTAVEARARAAFLTAFDELPASAPRRWRPVMAAAAGLAIVLIGALLARWPIATPDPRAELAYGTGSFQVAPAATEPEAGGVRRIRYGSVLDTASDGRLLVTIDALLSIRLDGDTRVRLVSPAEVELLEGRLYVDSERAAPLVVRTAAGTVTDVGTRFEVIVRPDGLTVALREGRVEVAAGAMRLESRADGVNGELLAFSDGMLTERRGVPTTDPRWRWIAQAQPGFALDGASVDAYLAWAAREGGYTLRYASPAVRQQAEMPRALVGSARAQADLESIRLLLETTRFELVEPARDELVVRFRS